MKKIIILIFFFSNLCFGQDQSAYKSGEWLNFKLSYSGWIKAGKASLEIKEDKLTELYHVKAIGKTTGPIKWFFKVEDYYQSYFSSETGLPKKFIRKINEGGYTKDKEILFNHQANLATVKDFKKNTEKSYEIGDDIQDMLSALYYLRNQDFSHLSPNDEIELKLFFDEETYVFKLLYLGNEVLKTKFGNVNSLIFKPMVQSGRVFKEKESVTIWVSADKNKIPLRIKASLVNL